MRHNIRSAADRLIADRNNKRKLYATVAALGLVVVFSVFYLLILPAITMESEPVCGYTEHYHSDGCYGDITQSHSHTDECFASQLVNICETDDTGHKHDADCFVTGSFAVCSAMGTDEHTLDVSGEDFGLVYTVVGVVCGLEEHTHTGLCYSPELMMSSMSMGIQSVNEFSDLYEFVVSDGITITDRNGNPIPDGVVVGENYLITLKFAENPEGKQFAYDENGFLTYELPEEILVPNAQSGFILGIGSAHVGWYTISETGEVTIKFDNVDTGGNPTTDNFIDNYNNAFFNMEIQAQFHQIQDGHIIEFGDNASVVIKVDNKPKLIVDKTASSYNHQTYTIEYTIEVAAVNGTVTLDKLTDVLSESGNAIDSSYSLADFIDGVTVRWTDGNGQHSETYTLSQLSVNGYAFEIPLDGITLNNNEKVTITYSVNLEKALKDKTVFDSAAINTVTVTGKDEHDNPITGDDEVRVPFKKDGMLRKTVDTIGETDNGTKFIKWFAYVGDGVTDLRGADITDSFGDGLVFGWGATQIHVWDTTTGESRHIFACDWQHHVSDQGEWHNHYHGDYSSTGMHVLDVQDNLKGFTYTVPNSGEPVYYLTLCYFTTFENQDNPTGAFSNTVSIDFDNNGPDDSYTGTIEVGPWDIWVDKSSEMGEEYIKYTVEAYIPASLYGKSMWIEDYLSGNYIDKHGNSISIKVENLPYGLIVETRKAGQNASENRPLDPSVYTFLDSKSAVISNMKDYWALYFVEGMSFDTLWDYANATKSPFEENTILTITYKIPLSARVLTSNAEQIDTQLNMTLGDAMKTESSIGDIGGAYNWLQMPSNDGYWHTLASDEDFRTLPVHKKGEWINENEVKYTVLVTMGSDGQLASGDPLVAPVFTDTFDSRLEYVPESFQIFRDDGYCFYLWENGYEWYDKTQSYITDNGNGTSTLRVDFGDINGRWTDADGVQTPEPDWYAKTGCSYYIGYRLKIKDTALLELGVVEFDNTANVTFTINGEKRTFSDNFTVEYGEPVVTKSMIAAGNTASVEIIINPEQLDLAGDADYFVMRDKMSDTLAFYLSTIVVEYKSVQDTVWQTAVLIQNGEGLWSYTTVGDNEISMVLPDNTAIKITYKALIKGDDNQTVGIKNEVWVGGQYDSVTQEGFVITDSNANAGGSKGGIQVIKDNALQHEIHLNGAMFALYAGYAYSGNENAQPDEGIDRQFAIDGVIFYYVGIGETGADGNASGTYTFDSNVIIPNGNYVFALVEIASPEGYILPTNGDEITLVYFDALKEAQKDLQAVKITDFINIPNSPYQKLLPATGGDGVEGYTAIGLTLIGISGAATIIRGKKKRRSTAARTSLNAQ